MKITSKNYEGKLYIKLGRKHIPLEQDIVYFEKLEQENEQLKQQLENEKQLNAEIKKRLVEVEYDCKEFNHEYCDINCKGKRKETIDLYQLISDGLNETLLKQKDEENEQLAKRICELRSDLSKAKSTIEKMKCCGNCKWLERENEYVYCKHTYCAKNLHSKWELKE